MFTNLIKEEISTFNYENSEKFKWFRDENEEIFFLENKTGKKRFGRLINCENCNREFCVRIREKAKYCSRVCSQKGSRVERKKLNCSSCDKEFLRTENRLQLSKRGFLAVVEKSIQTYLKAIDNIDKLL